MKVPALFFLVVNVRLNSAFLEGTIATRPLHAYMAEFYDLNPSWVAVCFAIGYYFRNSRLL